MCVRARCASTKRDAMRKARDRERTDEERKGERERERERKSLRTSVVKYKRCKGSAVHHRN